MTSSLSVRSRRPRISGVPVTVPNIIGCHSMRYSLEKECWYSASPYQARFTRVRVRMLTHSILSTVPTRDTYKTILFQMLTYLVCTMQLRDVRLVAVPPRHYGRIIWAPSARRTRYLAHALYRRLELAVLFQDETISSSSITNTDVVWKFDPALGSAFFPAARAPVLQRRNRGLGRNGNGRAGSERHASGKWTDVLEKGALAECRNHRSELLATNRGIRPARPQLATVAPVKPLRLRFDPSAQVVVDFGNGDSNSTPCASDLCSRGVHLNPWIRSVAANCNNRHEVR